MHPVVKTFYDDVKIVPLRKDLEIEIGKKADNFAVVNNRADHWVTLAGLSEHIRNYTHAMNKGCRLFYSFRDTQIIFNRLIVNIEDMFVDWALSLEKHMI